MKRMTDQEADRFQELADEIHALATTLNNPERHLISDAANLIKWVAFDCARPGDPDSAKAIAEIRAALGGNHFLETKKPDAP